LSIDGGEWGEWGGVDICGPLLILPMTFMPLILLLILLLLLLLLLSSAADSLT
jgi:hypothetical protein